MSREDCRLRREVRSAVAVRQATGTLADRRLAGLPVGERWEESQGGVACRRGGAPRGRLPAATSQGAGHRR